jgi:dehydrogenase/reductase SDR family protein 4
MTGMFLCARAAARLVVSSHLQDDTDEAARKLVAEGFDAKGVKCDIMNASDIAGFGERASEAFGKVDILFCLAAVPAPLGSLYNLSLDAFNEMLVTTVSANLALMRQFLPGMAERKDGSIVVMSSISSMRANPMLAGYGASKTALNGIIRSVATEWGAFNIRANALAPSVVRTNFSKEIWSDPEREKWMLAKIPARRIADPEDIVGAAILLASPAGSYISGQVLLIDGARSIT